VPHDQGIKTIPALIALNVDCCSSADRITHNPAHLCQNDGFTAAEAIGFLRVMRPGSVIAQQQHFLEKIEKATWRGNLPEWHVEAPKPLVANTVLTSGRSHSVLEDRCMENLTVSDSKGVECMPSANSMARDVEKGQAQRSRHSMFSLVEHDECAVG